MLNGLARAKRMAAFHISREPALPKIAKNANFSRIRAKTDERADVKHEISFNQPYLHIYQWVSHCQPFDGMCPQDGYRGHAA